LSSLRTAHIHGSGGDVGRPTPAWLVDAADTPKPVRLAVKALADANTAAYAAEAVSRDASAALKEFDDETRRATGRGDEAPSQDDRPALVLAVESAKGAVAVRTRAALAAAYKAEDAMNEHGEALRQIEAAHAIAAHERAGAALREVSDALAERELAWDLLGQPAAAGHWRTVPGLMSRAPLSVNDLKVMVERFPTREIEAIAAGPDAVRELAEERVARAAEAKARTAEALEGTRRKMTRTLPPNPQGFAR